MLATPFVFSNDRILPSPNKPVLDNPCEEVERVAYQRPASDPFSLEEALSIIGDVRKHQHAQVLNYVEFMFFTGLHPSEAIALRWRHVDFRKKEMKIEQVTVYDVEEDSTKTDTERTVKLNSVAFAALQSQRGHTFLAGDYLFHDPATGCEWGYARITDIRVFWEITLKRTGIRYRRPYNTRHTYATVGLMSGVTPGFMAEQLGHSLEMFFKAF